MTRSEFWFYMGGFSIGLFSGALLCAAMLVRLPYVLDRWGYQRVYPMGSPAADGPDKPGGRKADVPPAREIILQPSPFEPREAPAATPARTTPNN